VAAFSVYAAEYPAPKEADWVARDFRFHTGEVMPELRLHYVTIGDPSGEPVLVLHGTAGSSAGMLTPNFAGELFGPGQPLDAAKYFIILPDAIGAGKSAKPSDGLRTAFPRYNYDDMVAAQHRLVTEGLDLRHLRLILGNSMGGMHAWIWGVTHPDFMDALVPMASQPTEMSSRNWLMRRMLIDAVRNDPDWNGGNYEKNPTHYIYSAPIAALMTESATHYQRAAPSRAAMDALYQKMVAGARKLDANNQLYAIEAVMDYDPSPDLEKIKARLLAINFADDEVNPPELGVVEPAIKRIPGARFVLVPASEQTHGHYTYNLAALWKQHLAGFMRELPPMQTVAKGSN
jgi:homoserine O-acetyltransferase